MSRVEDIKNEIRRKQLREHPDLLIAAITSHYTSVAQAAFDLRKLIECSPAEENAKSRMVVIRQLTALISEDHLRSFGSPILAKEEFCESQNLEDNENEQ